MNRGCYISESETHISPFVVLVIWCNSVIYSGECSYSQRVCPKLFRRAWARRICLQVTLTYLSVVFVSFHKVCKSCFFCQFFCVYQTYSSDRQSADLGPSPKKLEFFTPSLICLFICSNTTLEEGTWRHECKCTKAMSEVAGVPCNKVCVFFLFVIFFICNYITPTFLIFHVVS